MIDRVITKRKGSQEPFSVSKLISWIDWASNGLDVPSDTVAANVLGKIDADGELTTQAIHELQIKEFSNLGTEAGLIAAGRIYIGNLRKALYGKEMKAPPLWDLYEDFVKRGLWKFSTPYSRAELEVLDGALDYAEDLRRTVTQSRQIVERYAVKNMVTGEAYETPQVTAMRVAMGGMANMPPHRRVRDVINTYTLIKSSLINIPSPFYSFLGTPVRQGASCCVLTAKDTAISIAIQTFIAEMMTVNGAGIGAHMMIRSKGDPVRNGTIIHQGKVPYYRHGQTAVLANKQGARGGAMTMGFSCLDPEFFEILRLKNIKTPLEVKVKDIDYSLGYNNSFVRAVANGEKWMLVSYKDAPKLHHLMYAPDTKEFDAEFLRVLNDASIKKRIVRARDMAHKFLQESVETGRFYEYNTTWMNSHTPFKDTIHSSNLCMEIALATKAFSSMPNLYSDTGEDGEIALCSLAAIAAGRVKEEDYYHVAYYVLLLIDNVIEDMDYPFPSLAKTAKARRSVGVGITDFAHAMAEKGLQWESEEGKAYAFELAERHSFHLHAAALALAEERGVCEWASRTKYVDGWLPIDTANPIVMGKYRDKLKYDWEGLRWGIVRMGGLRFSVLEAHMPCESSSVASYHTNSVYPIRQWRVIKPSGANLNIFIAPGWDRVGKHYELAYDIHHDTLADYYSIFQTLTGQAISADFYIRHAKTGRRKISLKELLNNFIYRNQRGMKTRYYYNTSTETAVSEKESVCENCSL